MEGFWRHETETTLHDGAGEECRGSALGAQLCILSPGLSAHPGPRILGLSSAPLLSPLSFQGYLNLWTPELPDLHPQPFGAQPLKSFQADLLGLRAQAPAPPHTALSSSQVS